MNEIRKLSRAAQLTVAGLVLTATGMLLQIITGSVLYPSFAGPIVLLASAVIVAFIPGRWTAWVGLLVPLVLGLGAIVAALMTGAFIAQLTNLGEPGLFLGSLLHVVGLVGAVTGALAMLLQPARTTS
jgi:hypothetical protein